MAVIHISEAEVLSNPSLLLEKARAGEHIVVDIGDEAFSLTRLSAPYELSMNPRPRKLSEAIRRAEERGSSVTLDDQFGKDLEDVIRSHEHETLIDPWESF